MADRFLLHFSQKKPRNWRLRCLEEHPRDPGWEVGTYEKCHSKYRPKHEAGDTVLDVVVREQKPVVRSMFTITDTKVINGEHVWNFYEYYFSDSDPYELPGNYIKYRAMFVDTYLRKYSSEDPRKFVRENYALYKKGEKPTSINQSDWDRIWEMRNESINRSR